MRYLVVTALFLALFAAQAEAVDLWGCCIPPYGECFAGSAYDSQTAFRAACEASGDSEHDAIIRGEGSAATCNPFSECSLGCCCAGPDVFDSPTINSEEDLLRSTLAACSYKEGFEYRTLPAGSTCVSVCGGTPPPGGGSPDERFDVSGSVLNASDNRPLANTEVFIPLPGSEISATTGPDGTFRLQDVPRITTRVFAVHPVCQPGQSAPVLVERDVENIQIKLNCAPGGCAHATPSFAEAPSVVRGTDDVTFTLSVENSCGDFRQYEPLRCNSNFSGCVALPPTESPVITDAGPLEPETTYCYIARARFNDGALTESDQGTGACVTTGDEACMQDTEPSWCATAQDRAAVLSCDESNALTTTPCEPSQMCSARSGTPQCVASPACDRCNGLLGLFSSLLASPPLPDGLFETTCSQACVLDSARAGKPLLVDAYSSCLAISDCSQYASKDACTQDKCQVSECSWKNVSDELGTGICISPHNPPCRSCDDIFGTCTRELCEAISQSCYFDGENNGLAQTQGCISAKEMACRYYDTQEDCGTQAARYDVRRTGGERSGGTHARTTSSNDRLGLGACTWNGICYKDADMSGGAEDDCIENGRYYSDQTCVRDSTPPTTQFFLRDPAVYSRAEVRTLPYSVTDDQSPADLLTTYVCLDCDYPSQTFSTIALPEEGQRVLKYYSVDANGNLEQVKQLTIQVRDSGEPAIEQVIVEENR